MELVKIFGCRLRELRLEKGLTQSALAALCGSSRQYLGRVERGIASPSFKIIAKFAAVLDTDPEFFFRSPTAGDTASAKAGEEPFLRVAEEVADFANDALAFVNTDFTYGFANRRYREMWRKHRHEIVGQSVAEILGQEFFRSFVEPHLNKALAGEHVHFQAWYDFSPHPARFLDVNYYPYLEAGEILGVVVRSHDITRQKRAEEALEVSNELFAKAFDNDHVAMAVSRQSNGEYRDANPGFCKLTGYSREEVVGRTSRQLHHVTAEQRESIIAEIEALGRVKNKELTFKTKQGQQRTILLSISPLTIDGEACLISTMVDITRRKLAEEELKRNEAYLCAVLESTTDLICTRDEQNRLVRCNSSFAEFTEKYHHVPAETNMRTLDHLASTSRAYWKEVFDKVLAGDRHCETFRAQVEGVLHWYEMSLAPILREGRVIGTAEFTRDVTHRKEREHRLLVAHYALDSAMSGMLLADLHGRLTYVNAAFRDFFGYDKDENLLGRKLADFLRSPRDEDRIWDALERWGFFCDDLEGTRKDGTNYVLQLVAHRVCSPVGEPLCLMGSFLNVTEKRLAEEALQESEARLKQILASIPAGVLVLDPRAHVVVDANNKAAQLLGRPLENLVGGECRKQLCHSEEGHCPIEDSWNDRAEAMDHSLRTASGGLLHTLMSVSKIRLDGREHLLVGFIDVTRRKQAERELNKLLRAVENSPLSIVTTDLEGNIEYVNPAFSSITGYAREEAVGQNPRILKSDLHDEVFYKDLWDTITAGETWRGEMCNRKESGELFWEQVAIAPVRDEDGAITNYVAIKEDITEKKALEHLKEDVERIMRHDLKTPLNGIVGIPLMMLDAGDLSSEQREQLRLVVDAGRQMMDMINLSMTMYQIERDIYVYTPKVFDLLEALGRAMRDLADLARGRKVRLELSFEGFRRARPEQVMVMGEYLLTYSLLSNLVKNAVEASALGGTVSIRVLREENVVLEVHNQGVVPENIRAHFFEKYVTAGKKGGTGLGTYSARLMSKVQGWNLSMRTSGRDGTMLRLELLS